jgi:hypothetical protein
MPSSSMNEETGVDPMISVVGIVMVDGLDIVMTVVERGIVAFFENFEAEIELPSNPTTG